jgi:chemotaxis methyl-accepting protein methylase
MTATVVESGFVPLLEKIERERGFACASYKHSCLRRRIKTRMRAKGMDTYESYMNLLDREPREMDRLVDALTINVTRFFRNRAVWDLVATHVVPSLWFSERESIRVWSAGCATGEEALTAAILFHRHAAVNGMLAQIDRVSITGTDVDAGAVQAATRATYSEADVAELGTELRHRYFQEAAPFEPAAGVRRLVRYVRHDLLKDPYPTEPQDVIICRNVLIYFDRAVQQQVIDGFRDALAPGGYLILGKVESLLAASRAFERVAGRERIFRKVS